MKKFIRAFTLAEVLITLGIIGVVAAMTLPMLIENHKKIVIETRLKKFYSLINQTIQRAEVDYGDKKYWVMGDTDNFWNKYLEPYLHYGSYEYKRVGFSNDWRGVFLDDGSAFIMDVYGVWDDSGNQTHISNGGHFIFCPYAKDCIDGHDYNKWGRSQFVFGFWPGGESGRSYSASFKYHKDRGVEPYLNAWDGNPNSLYTMSNYGCNKTSKNFFCTAIIQRNGWKIPKDYPYKF